jgi:adenosylcobinamide-GDP ribazoletransferase
VSIEWRPAVLALQSMQHVRARYLPLVGALIGLIGGAVYWLCAQLWPSSVAVVLALLAIALLDGSMRLLGADTREHWFAKSSLLWIDVFVLLLKYNVLMALTAANLGFPVPANVALGLILVCGQAASRGLLVSVLPSRAAGTGDGSAAVLASGTAATDDCRGATRLSPRVSSQDLAVSLVLGFAPAALLGIPGLMGLAAAIIMRLGLAARIQRDSTPSPTLLNRVQQLTEACFYLGALASWKYI